jgi:predicted O-methyltransferase YrrM
MMSLLTPRINDFFASPVKLGTDGKEYRPSSTSVHFGEALTLHNLVLKLGSTRTLEIGLALGGSAIAIGEALESRGGESHHVALDPYQRAFGHVGVSELERLGLSQRVEALSVHSEEFLQEAVIEGRRFDLIFNDGPHSIGHKVTNTFFADRCLEVGGVLAFHDAFISSTATSVRYLVAERDYEVIPLPSDSKVRRSLRMLKYGLAFGRWYGLHIVPFTCRSLVALRKTSEWSY